MPVPPIPEDRQDGTTIRAAHVNQLAAGVNDLQQQINDLPPGGYSAYELWIQQPGNEGKSLADFFEALRSDEPGPAGPPGPVPAAAGLLSERPAPGALPGGYSYFAVDDLGGTTSTVVDGVWVRHTASAEAVSVIGSGDMPSGTAQEAIEHLHQAASPMGRLAAQRSLITWMHDFHQPPEADGVDRYIMGAPEATAVIRPNPEASNTYSFLTEAPTFPGNVLAPNAIGSVEARLYHTEHFVLTVEGVPALALDTSYSVWMRLSLPGSTNGNPYSARFGRLSEHGEYFGTVYNDHGVFFEHQGSGSAQAKSYCVTKDLSGAEQRTEIASLQSSTVNDLAWHNYRIDIDPGGPVAHFFVDGVLVATHTQHVTPTGQPTLIARREPTSTDSTARIPFEVDYMQSASEVNR